jgi:Rrf2 family nitric oxide-sensitive transcriptional repressor
MLVTRKTDYAVRCVLFLAVNKNQVSNVAEVSKEMRIPRSFLAKIFQQLAGAGLVESIRGMKGGFRLAKKPSDISLLDIMTAIQGAEGVNLCVMNSRKCRLSSTCTVHPVWVDLRREMNRRLQEQTIDQLTGAK